LARKTKAMTNAAPTKQKMVPPAVRALPILFLLL
jgi:hypothetical protein